MKKRIISYVFIFLTIFTVSLTKVYAGTVNMKVTSNKSTVIVGNSITVTVTVSSSEALGTWVYTLAYDKNKFSFSGGNYALSLVGDGDGSKKSINYTYTFKAKSSGTAKFSLTNYQGAVWNEPGKYATVNASTSSVKVMTQAELEATYSKNNYLKSLSIEGHNIEFNKDTLEYNIELENDVTSIKINAEVEDSKSSLNGAGEINVSEGQNKIEIIVTAQNGNTKTYIINATVKELAPITVKINDKDYSVIRKKGVIDPPENYEETTVTINEEEVLAYKNEITKYILIGLKDSEGNSSYYIYNEETNTYTPYKELSFNKLNLILKEINEEDIPKHYKKTYIAINDNEITVYKLKESSNYSLIYGMNVDTGETNLYLYDSKEHTIQKYNNEEATIYKKQCELYLIALISLISLITVVILTLSIIFITKKRKIKNIKNSYT